MEKEKKEGRSLSDWFFELHKSFQHQPVYLLIKLQLNKDKQPKPEVSLKGAALSLNELGFVLDKQEPPPEYIS